MKIKKIYRPWCGLGSLYLIYTYNKYIHRWYTAYNLTLHYLRWLQFLAHPFVPLISAYPSLTGGPGQHEPHSTGPVYQRWQVRLEVGGTSTEERLQQTSK